MSMNVLTMMTPNVNSIKRTIEGTLNSRLNESKLDNASKSEILNR